jgi:hypothetical protein
MACSPRQRSNLQWLEVEPHNQLDQTATGIVGRRNILIGVREAAEGRCVQATKRVDVVGGVANQEVDVVESVQELTAKLEVSVLRKPDSLNDTQV